MHILKENLEQLDTTNLVPLAEEILNFDFYNLDKIRAITVIMEEAMTRIDELDVIKETLLTDKNADCLMTADMTLNNIILDLHRALTQSEFEALSDSEQMKIVDQRR